MVHKTLFRSRSARRAATTTGLAVLMAMGVQPTLGNAAPAGAARSPGSDLASLVDPFVGSAHDGNTWPGATAPFGMMAWSPTVTSGDQTTTPVANGYSYDADRVRGFSLTHVNGAGCAPGAAGDIPIMPWIGNVDTSPTADSTDAKYATNFSHDGESASPGRYSVQLADGTGVDLATSTRAGVSRFVFPRKSAANVLFRTSNSINGSENATVAIDRNARTVSGSVTTGGFCGRRGNGGGADNPDRRTYYRLYFTAVFDQPFANVGTWHDSTVMPGRTHASGGEGYLTGADRAGRGSGGWVGFDTSKHRSVGMRVGISYVSPAGAAANLRAEVPAGSTVKGVAARTRGEWNRELSRITVSGGGSQRTSVFYTALYHALMQPQTLNDRDGRYLGPDLRVHRMSRTQQAVYGTFSGWDQYRAQIQLLGILRPDVAGDMAQSMLEFARENGGIWDRWLHLGAPTHVMTGDPSAATVATWAALGVTNFDQRAAYASLMKQATVQNAEATDTRGCPGQCTAQRPELNSYLAHAYAPDDACACWGGAAETLEDSIADSALGYWAGRLGDPAVATQFAARGQFWKNTYDPTVGYQRARLSDGTFRPDWDPTTQTGFAQGSSAQYTWLVPQDVSGLASVMGGRATAVQRLDAFFHDESGAWAVTGGSAERFDPTNEPDIHTPWLYNALGVPTKTQQTVRQIMDQAYGSGPSGLPGNDDLGTMSAWYVFAAMGIYPQTPGRAELLIGSPSFTKVVLRRSSGQHIVIRSSSTAVYVHSARLDGRRLDRSWLPASFLLRGGRLDLTVSGSPNTTWATSPDSLPIDR